MPFSHPLEVMAGGYEDLSESRVVVLCAGVGQKAGETKGEGPEGFHGPASISPDGKIASMAYSPAVVNLDINDAANPKRLL